MTKPGNKWVISGKHVEEGHRAEIAHLFVNSDKKKKGFANFHKIKSGECLSLATCFSCQGFLYQVSLVSL
jgi:hypothetical protein